MTKQQQSARDEAIASLRETLKPGDTVYCILRHRSRSGMYRAIDLFHFTPTPQGGPPMQRFWLSRLAAKATGFGFDEKREAVRASGCGMDMGFHLVSTLSRVLFREGFECIGKGCPSNDHVNGDRDYTPHHHQSGDYALRHEWL